MNNILHTSGHLKYQELTLFYAFFKSIKPRVTFSELYEDKPGAMVARVPNFTAGLGSLYDLRGWIYVHMDEALEMLIIRLIKALNVQMLPYLETAGAWLLSVSAARMVIRTVTAASHSYQRLHHDEITDQDLSPLNRYDRYAAQSTSVRAMVDLMRAKSFLSLEHRNSEKLQNVFGENVEDLRDNRIQELILDIEEYGKNSAVLHASAMFPEVFGGLSDKDTIEHFGGKRFKGEWTKFRQVPTAGAVMASQREESDTELL